MKYILDMDLDKSIAKQIVLSTNLQCIMSKKSIEWKDSFWKQNLKEEDKLKRKEKSLITLIPFVQN